MRCKTIILRSSVSLGRLDVRIISPSASSSTSCLFCACGSCRSSKSHHPAIRPKAARSLARKQLQKLPSRWDTSACWHRTAPNATLAPIKSLDLPPSCSRGKEIERETVSVSIEGGAAEKPFQINRNREIDGRAWWISLVGALLLAAVNSLRWILSISSSLIWPRRCLAL